MNEYQHILVAIDLSQESLQVVERAIHIGKINQAKISLVHVIEPLGYAYGGDIPMDLTEIQQHLDDQANKQMAEISEKFGLSAECRHVVIGRPESEIHRFAQDQQADLIVVGSHGRHGFQLLLGSTANGVLHGAACDVLAVRIQDQK